MTRYVGTGEGRWAGDWYQYTPSTQDRVTAREFGEQVAQRVLRQRNRQVGYGDAVRAVPASLASGFLGECAALLPFGSGPESDVWGGRGWTGRADLGDLEVRTTSSRQLYTFATHADRFDPGLGGWRVTAKDAGRIIVCVEDRTKRGDLVVHGYIHADDVPRLDEPLGAILAVIEPPELLPFAELVP